MLSTVMFALGKTLPAFWSMANNSWMQVSVRYVMKSGVDTPTDS